MHVYVAAASSDVDRAAAVMSRLRRHGISVTSTWPEVVAKFGANPMESPRAERYGWAKQDLAEIQMADVLWLLLPGDKRTDGAHVEFGFAIATGKRLIVTGDERSIFTAWADWYPSETDAINAIMAMP